MPKMAQATCAASVSPPRLPLKLMKLLAMMSVAIARRESAMVRAALPIGSIGPGSSNRAVHSPTKTATGIESIRGLLIAV